MPAFARGRAAGTLLALTLAFATACASAPPAAPRQPAPIGPTFEQKTAWTLRLEDQRMLRDPEPAIQPPPPAPPALPARGRGRPQPVAAPPPPLPPDLLRLLSDSEARVRRRAALAIGRVGLGEGVPALIGVLADPDPEVRQIAAFSLGLLRDARARDPLVAALGDRSPLVQGSAAEALGLLGDGAAAAAVGRLVAGVVDSGALAQVPGDDEDARRDTPASAFRLGIYALVRLQAYDQLASAVLDKAGQPRVRWWPVAYALQRLGDPRALAAIRSLAREPHPYTRAFAVKGLGVLKDQTAVPLLLPLATGADRAVAIEAIRALAQLRDPAAGPLLLALIQGAGTEPHIRLEAVSAIGSVRAPGVFDVLLDLLFDPSPPIRAAALQSAVTLDADAFVAVLSGLDADSHWTVRAALASALGTLTPEGGLPRLLSMLRDLDQRVVPAVIAALVKLKAPNLEAILLEHLTADDPVVRAAAATGLGELKPASGPQALAAAYAAAERDSMYTARAAALAALAKYGAEAATPVLRTAFADKDWAVRVRAAMLMKALDPAAAAGVDSRIRPAPTTVPPEAYQSARLVTPPVSTQVYIDTSRGTIQIELAMLDAPLTVESFITLARKGFFNGLAIHRVVPDFVVQDGDPRGDGEGGPGYTIRDELNERPYLRGTVGMALDPWPDTGGSQFFITHSPQPHLDAKYTVFGRVIAGAEVVDQIQQGDVIRQVRVWDGETMSGLR